MITTFLIYQTFTFKLGLLLIIIWQKFYLSCEGKGTYQWHIASAQAFYVIYTFICALKTKGNSTYVSTVFWCRVIRVSPFANRLAMNIPPEIQFLRCLANYEALRFSSPILTFAHKLVSRMIKKSSGDDGKYVSIHLRFEEVLMLLHHLLPNYLFNLCDCVFLLPWHLISEL